MSKISKLGKPLERQKE